MTRSLNTHHFTKGVFHSLCASSLIMFHNPSISRWSSTMRKVRACNYIFKQFICSRYSVYQEIQARRFTRSLLKYNLWWRSKSSCLNTGPVLDYGWGKYSLTRNEVCVRLYLHFGHTALEMQNKKKHFPLSHNIFLTTSSSVVLCNPSFVSVHVFISFNVFLVFLLVALHRAEAVECRTSALLPVRWVWSACWTLRLLFAMNRLEGLVGYSVW